MSDSGWESISFAGLINEKLQMFLQSLVNCFCKFELLNESWQQGWSLRILAGISGISHFSLLSNLLNKNQSENFQIHSTFSFIHQFGIAWKNYFPFQSFIAKNDLSVWTKLLQKQSRKFFSFQSRTSILKMIFTNSFHSLLMSLLHAHKLVSSLWALLRWIQTSLLSERRNEKFHQRKKHW